MFTTRCLRFSGGWRIASLPSKYFFYPLRIETSNISLLKVLIGLRWEVAKSNGIEDHLWLDSEITFAEDANTGAPVRVPPLHAHFTKLTRQCEAFLAGASALLESGSEDEIENAVQSLSLCGEIIAARDDLERAIDDGVNVIKALLKDPRLVPGAGATELELAKRVEAYGSGLKGLSQHAVRRWAQALEVVPRTLAENALGGGEGEWVKVRVGGRKVNEEFLKEKENEVRG